MTFEILKEMIQLPRIFIRRRAFLKDANFPFGVTSVNIGSRAICSNETHDAAHITIGKQCDINGTLIVQDSGSIRIGDYSTIRYNSVIGSVDSITIGNYVIISNHVTIFDNNNHPTDPQKRMKMCESGFYSDLWKWKWSSHKPIVINDNVWIGEHATILKGVIIGKGAIVGCHAVVTHDVPPYTIVAGNPAKIVKCLEEEN